MYLTPVSHSESVVPGSAALASPGNLLEMQTKTTVRYYLTPVRMAVIKKSANNKYWRGCGEKGMLLHSFGRKVMTNLDSIFKSRDITLPTKVLIVKAMFFPVVMYECESWTIKKAEC